MKTILFCSLPYLFKGGRELARNVRAVFTIRHTQTAPGFADLPRRCATAAVSFVTSSSSLRPLW